MRTLPRSRRVQRGRTARPHKQKAGRAVNGSSAWLLRRRIAALHAEVVLSGPHDPVLSNPVTTVPAERPPAEYFDESLPRHPSTEMKGPGAWYQDSPGQPPIETMNRL